MTRDELIDFTKIFGVVLLFAGGACGLVGLLPRPVLIAAAIGVLAVAIHRHRNSSLV